MAAEDYIIKQFQQLGKVLAAIIGLYEKRNFALAIDEIDQVFSGWFKVAPSAIEMMTTEELLKWIEKPTPHYETEQALGELLFQKYRIFQAMEQHDEARGWGTKALAVLNLCDENMNEFSLQRYLQIQELNPIVNGIDKV